MGVKDVMFSRDDIENLADELALVYIQKSDITFASPQELARFFVKTQKSIVDELSAIRCE